MFFEVLYPHVFIEIPVYLICASLGLLIAENAKEMILKNDLKEIENKIKKSFKRFIFAWPVIIILLFISAYLEAFA